MAVYLAHKTLSAIEDAIAGDQGSAYRGWLGKVIGHMDDAYREDEFPFRSHMGASGIGKSCARSIWYGFRWATLPRFDGRLLRLFNRGHLEEARFIAMLLTIGCRVYQQDANGKQFRISDAGGHFGGSGDGVGVGIPDLDPELAALLEFKTSAEKPFLKLEKEGVREAKFEHYVQMNVYMHKMGLPVALYICVNKNNDKLYAEIVPYNREIAEQFIDRGNLLVFSADAPKRINESPGWFECRFCDHRDVCHLDKAPHRNCRTCKFSEPVTDGRWVCNVKPEKGPRVIATKEEQLEGCPSYERAF